MFGISKAALKTGSTAAALSRTSGGPLEVFCAGAGIERLA